MRDFHITYVPLTSAHFNEHLKYLKDNGYNIVFRSYEDSVNSGLISNDYFEAYLKVNFINITLTYRKYNKWVNICHNLAIDDKESELVPIVDPSRAYSHLQRFCHIADVKEQIDYTEEAGHIYWAVENLGALRYFNPRFFGKRYENVYGYDMNSAFLTACIDLPMPNCDVRYHEGYPKKGEVGFNADGVPFYGPSSFHCAYVFPCYIDDNLTKWAKRIYEKKKNSKTAFDRQKWKDMGNLAIGMIARHNPFFRNCIIFRSNQTMLKLIDKNTILCNTDSIVTQVKRDDLKLGKELGEYKIEHQGMLGVTERGYQWNNDLPVICGFVKDKANIFKEVIGRDYDILIDDNLNELFIQRYIDLNRMRIFKRDLKPFIVDFLKKEYDYEKRSKINEKARKSIDRDI